MSASKTFGKGKRGAGAGVQGQNTVGVKLVLLATVVLCVFLPLNPRDTVGYQVESRCGSLIILPCRHDRLEGDLEVGEPRQMRTERNSLSSMCFVEENNQQKAI